MPADDASAAAEIEQLLAAGRAEDALRAADALCARSRRNLNAWLARASANMRLGRIEAAVADLETGERAAPGDRRTAFLRAHADQQLGRMEPAVARLRPIAYGGGPLALEAWMALCDTLFIANRLDELREEVAQAGPWTQDERFPLHAARARAKADPAAAITALQGVADAARNPAVRRVAGFEAVRLLDKAGRFREALELAGRTHASTGMPFDLEGFLAPVRAQRQLLAGGRWFTPQAEPVEGLAMMVALPRSGTTLLEQMLDAHPAVSGIGEYDGTRFLGESLAAMGRQGRALAQLTRPEAIRLQRAYLDGAERRRRAGARWMLDKTLRAWRLLPPLAAVMPGTRCMHVVRDPRDMAVSIHLSYFTPERDGWTASLESIRRVIEAHESILPEALAALGLPHETVVYEDLVADPQAHAGRCLGLLGLGMEDAVLAPERNARTVFTLSHAQVSAPINASSIGRWRNYAWAFGKEWDALVARHEARRKSR
jgi:tetratricopeptide (TPR) repeat protein